VVDLEAISVMADAAAPATAETLSSVELGGAAELAEAPKPILIWRQGRPERDRRPQRGAASHHGRDAQTRHQGRRGDGAASQDGEGGRAYRAGPHTKGTGKRDGGKPRWKEKGDDQGRQAGKPREREKPFDPDSPFAKLAALKQQLKS
jgi:ATP-dependent RNA helicase SUPV3L1/SUV3